MVVWRIIKFNDYFYSFIAIDKSRNIKKNSSINENIKPTQWNIHKSP